MERNDTPKPQDSEHLIEITSAQQSATNILFCLDVISILSHEAKVHSRMESQTRRAISRKVIYERTRTELIRMFLNSEMSNELEGKAELQNNPENTIIETLFQHAQESIEAAREKRTRSASTLTRTDILKMVFKAGRRLSSLKPEEQNQILRHAGYEREEIDNAIRHISTSSLLTGGIVTGGYLISAGFIAKETLTPSLSTINDSRTQILLLTTYLLRYVMLAISAQQNTRLLKRFGTSSNVLATTVYLLLNKLYPDNKKLVELATQLATVGPPFLQDFIATGALMTPIGPSILAVRNIAATAVNSGVILGGEFALRRKGKQEE